MAGAHEEERLFLSTTPGLEPALEQEAASIGRVKRVEGGLELVGPPGLHRRANLELRTASRVLLRLGALPPTANERERANAFKTIARRTPLDKLASATLRADTRATQLRSDVLVREFLRAWGGTEVKGGDEILLRSSREGLTISIDTSGELLYRRGYRQEVSHAPLRETLAAGILLLAGFSEDAPLIDPMCGSGTLLIEGALLATRRAPGLARTFAFERWPGHDAAAWEKEKAAAQSRIRRAPAALIGTDIHAGSLGTARRNARRAGVVDQLQLERRDLREARPPPGAPGWIVANPPYGKRVGESGDLPALYRALGQTLKTHFRGWRAAVLVPEARLSEALALPAPRRIEVDNGGIRLELQIAGL